MVDLEKFAGKILYAMGIVWCVYGWEHNNNSFFCIGIVGVIVGSYLNTPYTQRELFEKFKKKVRP